MFLKTKIVECLYYRRSKLGKEHSYRRKKTVVCLRCDECDSYFERDLKHIEGKRLNNNYFHCCHHCDAKRFAQKRGAERKKIWDLPASIDLPVGKH